MFFMLLKENGPIFVKPTEMLKVILRRMPKCAKAKRSPTQRLHAFMSVKEHLSTKAQKHAFFHKVQNKCFLFFWFVKEYMFVFLMPTQLIEIII